MRSKFVPDRNRFTCVISSPAHFVDEYESAHFLLTHAWPTFGFQGNELQPPDSPMFRSFFALSFAERELTEEQEKQRQPPHYRYVGDFFCVFLSLLYGKLFCNHGFMMDHGHFCLPQIDPAKVRSSRNLTPFSSKPRKDVPVPLNLKEVGAIVSVFDKLISELGGASSESPDIDVMYAAGRFYHQALELYDTDPEIAYFSLVSAGEVLASNLTMPFEALHDPILEPLIREIDERLDTETAAELRQKLFGQISRKFRIGLSSLLNDAFYGGSEAEHESFKLMPATVVKHLNAAYSLRSKFAHAGVRFGNWVKIEIQNSEIAVGKPAYGDPKMQKLLSETPTLAGLERVIRFCLLRFVHLRICRISSCLD